jgi:osmotically inducible protein OsmC
MAVRVASTQWSGGLQDGSGQVTLVSSGVGTYDVSFPRRAADDAEGVTSPEELIAAAHSSCYSMALSNELTQAGGTVNSLVTQADVTLGPDPAGGVRISGIKLTVRGQVSGLDDDAFRTAAEAAKVGCPVSKALTGTTITLDAALA